MPEYRVVRGTHRRRDGSVAEQGETVEMSEQARAGLPDRRFELVEDEEPEQEEDSEDETTVSEEATDSDEEPEAESADEEEETEADPEPEPEPEEEPEPNGVDVEDIIPYDNYRLLSRMAADYSGDEVHGAMSGEDIADFLESLTVPDVQELKRQAEADLSGDD